MATESQPAIRNNRARKLLTALEGNWQAEMEGYYTYLALADREHDALRAQVLRHLADAELEHAELWANRIKELGGEKPTYKGDPRGDADSLLSRAGGPRMALRRLEVDEARHIANYGKQLKELGDEASVRILEHVIEDEKEHYHELGSLLRGRATASHRGRRVVDAKGMLEELLTKRNQGRAQTGGWIGDAIYGVNDGLGAIFGIVSGISGATAGLSSTGQAKFVLLSGLAGMIASALSMGSGAYLAAKSEREIYEAEVEREREAIALNPSEARELLSLYYQVKGLPQDDADHVVEHLAADPDLMLKSMAAERLGGSEDGLKSPLISATSGALSTAVGAIIPVIPFFFLSGLPAVITAAIVSLVAHFAVGAAKSLITVRSWWASGFEMTAVGAVEGAVTYAIGLWLGGLGA
ncbi:MAG TPA: VIT1/CCC1 transporter family protein [Acidobacteriaceae bacterium]